MGKHWNEHGDCSPKDPGDPDSVLPAADHREASYSNGCRIRLDGLLICAQPAFPPLGYGEGILARPGDIAVVAVGEKPRIRSVVKSALVWDL